VHAPLRVTLRHFLMHDAAARSHPLNVAGAKPAAITKAVAVLDGAGKNISDGLDAAVGMPREAGEIVLRPIVAEVIQQQKRVGLLRVAKAESPAQLHPGAFDCGFRLHDALNGTNGHGDQPRASARSSLCF
jgi:hypothetical protein